MKVKEMVSGKGNHDHNNVNDPNYRNPWYYTYFYIY